MTTPVIHRSKLFGGADVREVYAAHVFAGARCSTCSSDKVAIRIQTFLAIDDIKPAAKREAVKLLVASGEWKKVPLDDGKIGVRVGLAFACAACQPEAERVAARAPSYARLTFDRLPGADRPQVQVLTPPSSLIIVP